ncbi:ferredoxin reductase [Knoellia aerolata]|uniref:Stearoyl-CoA 9-desaturase n=1 Tax=Knoellia aerolata DSM 18566 TaxID=1385519 RepID=A0A0A0JXM9_9MICO|nr:ferredoxin reductase [Knoellia aerolata]KGN41459.1 stearoyl-CoA 9-desaturase [Knoellia aerolata DSM 18566]
MTATLNRLAPSRRPARLAGLLDGARKVAEAIATPLVPSDYLDLIDPLRAGAELRGRIVSVAHETADAATITIRPGKGWLGHRPGQYIRIGIDIDGVRHWRAYSLTHRADASDGLISITTKAIPDGKVSNHLVRQATPGTLVMLDQATGDFTLPQAVPAKALFLTAGSGITPVIGMLRNHLGELPDVAHVHCAPTEADVIFREELRGYAAASRLTLHENHDDVAGILDLASLDDLVPDWREREVWVCGPTGLLDAAEAHWAEAGLAELLHVERFRPSIIEPGEGGSVTFEASGVTVDADGSTPILDAGEAAGVLMPSGCRMGICFGCVVTMRDGAVRDLRSGEITVADESTTGTKIQTCINAVAGRCDIEL